jgi:formiminoglutamase
VSTSWLEVTRGSEPLVVSIPHTGTDIPPELLSRLVSPWLARKDADWHIERLYGFAAGLGASVIRTQVSRTVIDVNRDPSGASLYPGMATTELCPTTTFDGEPLYRPGQEPMSEEIASRQSAWFGPYHAALRAEITRLLTIHGRVVLYDCHSIRSVIPRLFDGELPHFNIGTNGSLSCDPALTAAVEAAIPTTLFTRITNGRFRGGYITRHHGRPADGVHLVQMELAIRGYLAEPGCSRGADLQVCRPASEADLEVCPTGMQPLTEANWPPPYHEARAAPMRAVLQRVLEACLAFARGGGIRP